LITDVGQARPTSPAPQQQTPRFGKGMSGQMLQGERSHSWGISNGPGETESGGKGLVRFNAGRAGGRITWPGAQWAPGFPDWWV